MTFRYRKSISLGGGVRLNLSKTGVGVSCGVPGLRYSVHSSGRRSTTVGLPGTGLYWRDDRRTHRPAPPRSKTAPTRARPAPPRPISLPHKPGLLAPRGEKDLFKAVEHGDVASMDAVATAHPELRVAAETLSGLHRVASDPAMARLLLGQVFASGRDPAGDPFITAFVGHPFNVKAVIAPGVSVELPLGREALGLILAELHHRAGEVDAAIRVVEQLGIDSYVRVALADLYAAAGRDADVVRVTDGLTNTDDLSALLLLLRGVALRHAGHQEAARQALTEASRVRSRDTSIRLRAIFERGLSLLADGQRSRARHDFERVLAEDAAFTGLDAALAAVAPS